jgi:hypothetical protein
MPIARKAALLLISAGKKLKISVHDHRWDEYHGTCFPFRGHSRLQRRSQD